MKGRHFAIGAVITALASTLCCLPALLFLIFGVSSGFLAMFAKLEGVRWILALLSFIFLLVGFLQSRKKSCECVLKRSRIRSIGYVALFLLIVALAFYPEIVPLFIEE